MASSSPPPHTELELTVAPEESSADKRSASVEEVNPAMGTLASPALELAMVVAPAADAEVKFDEELPGSDNSHSERSPRSSSAEIKRANGGVALPGVDPSRTSSSINSHQDQWTTAVTKAVAHRSEQQHRCRGCGEWWRSSAGGKSGVVSVVLAVIIVLYAALMLASSDVADIVMGTAVQNVAETYLQVHMSVKVVVGSICVLLILFGGWTIRRITYARESTLEDIAKTAEARRNSKWLAIRVFTIIQEGKGPNSP